MKTFLLASHIYSHSITLFHFQRLYATELQIQIYFFKAIVCKFAVFQNSISMKKKLQLQIQNVIWLFVTHYFL